MIDIQRSFSRRPYSQLTFFQFFETNHEPCVTPRPKGNLVPVTYIMKVHRLVHPQPQPCKPTRYIGKLTVEVEEHAAGDGVVDDFVAVGMQRMTEREWGGRQRGIRKV